MQRELRILLLSSGFFLLAGNLFGPIYAVFVEEIGGDLLTAGGAYTAFAISAGALILLLGRWEDRVKHQERLIVIGYMLSCIGFFGYLVIRNPIDLFAVQIILGLGQAVRTPAYDAVYSRHMDKRKFASEWGTWESMHWIVAAIAASLGAFIAGLYGFWSLFLVMFLASVVGLAVSTLLLIKNKKK